MIRWLLSLLLTQRIWGVWVYRRGEGWMPGGTVVAGSVNGARRKAHRKHPGMQTTVELMEE